MRAAATSHCTLSLDRADLGRGATPMLAALHSLSLIAFRRGRRRASMGMCVCVCVFFQG